MENHAESEWWRSGVIYQIYPRSMQDSDGDGIGDIPGIESRLDHLVALGIDGIWISPFYPSPMVDFGYDIVDHCDVDPVFGTLQDLDRLIGAVHERGMRLILDLVPCHTSDRHPWFAESRSSIGGPKRDWYIWRDPAPDGGPPNNWQSEFGGPAWTLDPVTGQYYSHAHLTEQPDLNWRNPEVVDAILDVMRFWFARGVDGFRIDSIDQMVKDEHFRDNPPNPDWHEDLPSNSRYLRLYQKDRPDLHAQIARMRQVADEFGGRLLAGEAYLPFEKMARYYGEGLSGLQMPYNFHLIGAPWTPRVLASLAETYEATLPEGAWPNWVQSNHDRQRIASRIGQAQARVAAMLLLTLRGTPTIYGGEELGMENVPIPDDLVMDPWEKNLPGHGLGRDPVRTPIAWSTEPGAGFTTGDPWLPIDTRPEMTVSHQVDDPDSMLRLYRDLIALRRTEPALSVGDYRTVHVDDDVYCYARERDGRRLVVSLNLSAEAQTVPETGQMLFSTVPGPHAGASTLAPNEGRITLG